MYRTIQKISDAQYDCYQALFDYFNEHLFENSLPQVMLVFTRSTRHGGHFATGRWEEGIFEISLNPIVLKKEEPVFVCSILVHEMVHLKQRVFGAPSRSGYHNKQWGTMMEEIGLVPSNTGKPGGKRTGQRVSHYIIKGGDFDRAYNQMPEEILLPIKGAGDLKELNRGKNKSKFTCPKCGANAWGIASLKLIHTPCKKQMILVL